VSAAVPPGADAEQTGPGEAPQDGEVSNGDLVRRLFVFQFKLLLDGLRDLILSPVSVVAVLVGVFGGGPRRDGPFRDLLRFGRETDRWIDLFEAHEDEAADRPQASASALLDAVERAVREEYEGGGGRASVEARLRRLRDAQRGRPPEAAGDAASDRDEERDSGD
jgi:hypothetical protein